MAIVREVTTKHCKKARVDDDTYIDLPQEEISRRQKHIKDYANLLAREYYEKQLRKKDSMQF